MSGVWPLDRAVKENPFTGSWAEQPNELSLNACGRECIKSPLNRGADTSGMKANLFAKKSMLVDRNAHASMRATTTTATPQQHYAERGKNDRYL